MRAASSSPLVLASVLVSLAGSGCTEAAHGPLAGASDWTSSAEPSASAPVAPAAAVWDAYAEVRQWPPANPAPFTSQGHLPAQQVDVRVSEGARPSYGALVTDTVFPDGSVLVELSRGMGNGYAMRKAGGVWSYLELDAQGGVLESGALGSCKGCHAQAPADHVFGLPRPP